LPRTRLGKIRRYLLSPLYEAAQRHETPSAPAELSPEDRALLDKAGRGTDLALASAAISGQEPATRYGPTD
jgi:hypothetical protein